jgi:hypothetical protein
MQAVDPSELKKRKFDGGCWGLRSTWDIEKILADTWGLFL